MQVRAKRDAVSLPDGPWDTKWKFYLPETWDLEKPGVVERQKTTGCRSTRGKKVTIHLASGLPFIASPLTLTHSRLYMEISPSALTDV